MGLSEYPASFVAAVAAAYIMSFSSVILPVVSVVVSSVTARFMLFIIDVVLLSILIFGRYNLWSILRSVVFSSCIIIIIRATS
uniref:Uncharacterized protein n=1 Tax=Octopus bimaculoides TaxID=37653 RepID=A0A0L8IAQ4_OCTBM